MPQLELELELELGPELGPELGLKLEPEPELEPELEPEPESEPEPLLLVEAPRCPLWLEEHCGSRQSRWLCSPWSDLRL